MEGCLYSRHSSSNLYLDKGWPQWRHRNSKCIRPEWSHQTYYCNYGAETTLFQVEHIWRNICFSKTSAPRFGVKTTFVDINKSQNCMLKLL
jgi:hypothetical protein